jgi:hypothetical protein
MAKKLACASCGGTKKMKLGGSAVAKAPVNMYGIPQENMGTSSQMGFGRKGGSVKKMQVGGVVKKPLVKAQTGRTVKTKSIPDDVYKRDSTNYSNAANKYLNATSKKDYNEGRDSLNAIKTRYGTPNDLEKRMKRTVGGYDLKKKGGSVKTLPKAQDGRTVKTKTGIEGAKDFGKYVSTFGGATEKKSKVSKPKKTGMDALKDLGKYVSTFGLATEKYNPAPKKTAVKSKKK